jgi:L-asparaginase / beta-aspartyl-peptidase
MAVKACSSAFKLLKRGSGALEAVAEAARLLEDDGRFNAGSGSKLRLDGATVEMDAALMDSEGRLLLRVQAPVRRSSRGCWQELSTI